MIETKLEKIYYESEIITKATCDICGKDVTNENFYKMNLGYYYVPDEKGSFIRQVYDENSCCVHICEPCAKSKLLSTCKLVQEYINENTI